jgi:tetratricopeptide (TPR) repeat protein
MTLKMVFTQKQNTVPLLLMGLVLLCTLQPVYGQNQARSDYNEGKSLDEAALFMEAQRNYKEGKYSQAAQGFEKLLQNGDRNGTLYYNLGNSYFKMGMLGKAILSYRLAKLYTPRDEDLNTNLSYARQLTKDKIETKQLVPFLKQFCFWYSKLNIRELFIAFLIVHALFWVFALLKMVWRNEYLNFMFFITLALTAVLGFSFAIKLYHHSYDTDGVVLAKEVTVRSGNGINNTALFQLHDGAEFKITQQEGDWLKIELSDGKKGWIDSRWAGMAKVDGWPPLHKLP